MNHTTVNCECVKEFFLTNCTMGFSDILHHSPFCVMNKELLLLFSDCILLN
jgi:hypothetical protein